MHGPLSLLLGNSSVIGLATCDVSLVVVVGAKIATAKQSSIFLSEKVSVSYLYSMAN